MEIINLLVLVGIFSCVSVIYTNSRKNAAQMDEILALLRKIADKSGLENGRKKQRDDTREAVY